jgi:hypothetical protein
MKFASLLSVGGLAASLMAATAAEEDGWVSLCNGRDLAGWVHHGGKARYTVEDGCIIGTTIPKTPNSFLCTEKTYADFILELEFKVDPGLNSGVQVRSECFPQATNLNWKGKHIPIPAGRVHGYQVEIDPDPKRARWWTAGLYDEGRRGWLYPGQLGGDGKAFTQQGADTFKPGEWNRLRVEARGDTIKTWLNGVARAEIKDHLTPRGFIALQVHGVGDRQDKLEVRWRNLRLKELP